LSRVVLILVCLSIVRVLIYVAIIAVYVDDLIIVAKSQEVMIKIKCDLSMQFKMKDLGKIHYCLGITIDHDQQKGCLLMHQKQYIHKFLEKYGLSEAKPSTTPPDVSVKLIKGDGVSKLVDQINYQSMIGSLLYAATATTRSDISHAVGAVSKFNSCPIEAHFTAVKRILRYLKGTINLGLVFKKSSDSSLYGYSDADWAGDIDSRHSTTGNVFVMSGEAITGLEEAF